MFQTTFKTGPVFSHYCQSFPERLFIGVERDFCFTLAGTVDFVSGAFLHPFPGRFFNKGGAIGFFVVYLHAMTHQVPTISISKEALAKLPATAYSGGLTVVDTMEKARAALRYLRKARLIGFDTETRPSFRKGLTYKVALMQLYTDDHCFLFRLNKIGFPEELRKLLEDTEIVKIGLSVHDDFNALRRICPDFAPGSFIELQAYVKQFGISDISLQKIYAIVFGQFMSKNQRLTNWEAPELTPAQQAYAALDAKACLDLYVHLRQGNFDPWKSEYITDSTPHTVN